MDRRTFLGGMTAVFLSVFLSVSTVAAADFTFTRQRLFPGFDGKYCKICPCVGTDGGTDVFLTWQRLLLSGSDVFYGTFMSRSEDAGRTWSEPVEVKGIPDVRTDGVRTAYAAEAHYSVKNGRWYALGHSQDYHNDSVPDTASADGKPYQVPYQYAFDPKTGTFSDGRPLEVPFAYVGAYPFGQAVELDDGDLLVGFQCRPPESKTFHLTTYVVRYRFDGAGLKPVACGRPITRADLHREIRSAAALPRPLDRDAARAGARCPARQLRRDAPWRRAVARDGRVDAARRLRTVRKRQFDLACETEVPRGGKGEMR